MREDIFTVPTVDKLPFNIILAGISYCDGTYHIKRNNSPVTCVEYIISGSGVVSCDRQIAYPKKGDIYLLPAGLDQEYYSDSDDPWIKLWFNADGVLIQHLLAAYKINRKICFPDSGGGELIERIHQILLSEGLTPYEIQTRCSSVFFELVQRLAKETENDEKLSAAATVKQYIEQNAEKPLCVDNLAALISHSVSQTIRIFKKEYGITPYEYLLLQKLERAKLLLKNTNMRIKDISKALSFSDEHYFSGLFREKTGVSPGEYRRQ